MLERLCKIIILLFLLLLLLGFGYLLREAKKIKRHNLLLNSQLTDIEIKLQGLEALVDMLSEEYKRKLTIDIKEMVVTGYSNDRYSINVRRWRDGKTATNVKTKEGICAADWSYYPVGTLFYIPDYGICEVQDRGGLIKGENRLDLFFSTRRKALEWGVRKVTAVVIKSNLEEVD